MAVPHTFEDFWPFYVREHLKASTRALHFVGSHLALGALLVSVLTLSKLWLCVAPVAGYGLAWVGHFYFEKNRPATFVHPLWSLRGDARMIWLTWTGRMGYEVERFTPRGRAS
jgi:hypothetical protein